MEGHVSFSTLFTRKKKKTLAMSIKRTEHVILDQEPNQLILSYSFMG